MGSMVNLEMARSRLTADAKWCESHGAFGAYLGAGMLYYAIPYMTRCRVCVCLGSGGGFVPRMMAQARRDLAECGRRVDGSRTVLVDGDCGEWGRPEWKREGSFFRREFPEVEVVEARTSDAAREFRAVGLEVGYLHVDADHSKEGCLADLEAWWPMVVFGGAVTLHDTSPAREVFRHDLGVLGAVAEFRAKVPGFQAVNFPGVGAGVMLAVKGGR